MSNAKKKKKKKKNIYINYSTIYTIYYGHYGNSRIMPVFAGVSLLVVRSYYDYTMPLVGR